MNHWVIAGEQYWSSTSWQRINRQAQPQREVVSTNWGKVIRVRANGRGPPKQLNAQLFRSCTVAVCATDVNRSSIT